MTLIFFLDLAAVNIRLAMYSTSVQQLQDTISKIQSQEKENNTRLQELRESRERQIREKERLEKEIDDTRREIQFFAKILTFLESYLPPLEKARNCSENLNDRVSMDLALSRKPGYAHLSPGVNLTKISFSSFF